MLRPWKRLMMTSRASFGRPLAMKSAAAPSACISLKVLAGKSLQESLTKAGLCTAVSLVAYGGVESRSQLSAGVGC